MIHGKHFTIEEARVLVPKIRDKIKRIVHLKSEVDELGFNIYRHHFFTGQSANGEKYHPKELELISIIKEIQSLGALVKGLDNGLVDFPSIRHNGEEVYLCWLFGEDDIEYWHTIPDGFIGRKPLDTF